MSADALGALSVDFKAVEDFNAAANFIKDTQEEKNSICTVQETNME